MQGQTAIEVDVYTEGGASGSASSPSGISAGINEAYVLRDGDPEWYLGMGVNKAINYVKTLIEPALIGMDILNQKAIDERLIELDGTKNKTKLGGNTIYNVSLACVKAAANTLNMHLYQYLAPDEINSIPIPTFNCIDGGSYQKGTMPFQECTVIPYKAATIKEAVNIGWQVYHSVADVIKEFQNGRPAKVGSISGWQPPSPDPMICFDLLFEAAKRCRVEDKIALRSTV